MEDVLAEVVDNEQLSTSYYSLKLSTGWKVYNPGQFVMVKVPDEGLLIRRPFSIADLKSEGVIELCYKVVGRGTRALSKLNQGEEVKILGPLGQSFSSKNTKSAIIIAGGFGIAPFVKFARDLKNKNIDTTLFYGGRSADDILYLEYFKKLGVDLKITTEDGTKGRKGVITDQLLSFLEEGADQSELFCCGPNGLLHAVVGISKRFKLPAQLSYESYMGCGIGVCLGCVVPTKKGYKRACVDGPVFKADDIEE